ncbi:MAG: bifunctional nuclease family protein [Candidatus Aenigmarchaeota archaeon]|nr:bifunctional nuclease family protein [Candidatus Aenigmarchaeota archaeon]
MTRFSFVLVVILVAAAFFIGIGIGSRYRIAPVEEAIDQASISAITASPGFIEAETSIQGNTVSLKNGCRLIQFEVTPDQAYSIATGLANTSSQRPLTHDIFREALDNYDVHVLRINIDRFEEEIYKATIYFRRGNSVLALDARPSDSIALAGRYGIPLYIKGSILEEKGQKIC